MVVFRAMGDWPAVAVRCVPSTHRLPAAVEGLIALAWAEATGRLGTRLFDGPMCRMESFEASPKQLAVELSRTSYRMFLGTNLTHPELADRFGPDVLANPVGVSPALLTRDGFLMMGRRNNSVAYYPQRVHPFSGALEPRAELDIFAEVRRELGEELGFTDADVGLIRCTGLAEDTSIRQPELIFRVETPRTRAEIERQLDQTEHDATWAIPATRQAVEAAFAQPAELTPVAVAALLLWGRGMWGNDWFERAAATVGASVASANPRGIG